MKLIIFLLSIMITSQALANGGKNEPSGNSSSVSGAVAGSVSGSAAHSVSASKAASDAQSTSKVGDTTATGGDSSATGGNSQVTVRGDSTPRQAPAVAVLPPQSTSIGLKCFGFGMSQSRSDDAYGGGAGYCWKQRDDWAVARYTRLSSLGLFVEAAEAYCGQPMHWKDFGSMDKCKIGIYQALIDQQIVGQVVEESYQEHILLKQCDEEKGELLDRVTKECGTVRK